ncbi:MAG: plasmid mobilization relaxosome protein MobC [Pseudomonadota bacterium]
MPLDNLNDLKEQRAGKIAEMTQIRDKAEGEKRDLSGEERKRFDALEGEVRALSSRLSGAAERGFNEAAQQPAPAASKDRTALSPFTLRLTTEERTRLEELAAGMTLSAYVRACLFAEDTKLRKSRPSDAMADKRTAAEALALLGQSRIASNLNQLAHHANLGILILGEPENAQIEEAYDNVLAIRTLLMEALGKRPTASSAAPSRKRGS